MVGRSLRRVDDYLRAVVLGLVQAVTEFLPVSSSGHLILAPEVIGDEVSSLTFDVGLHIGTTVAVLTYFWRDWVIILTSGLRDLLTRGLSLHRWSGPGLLGIWIVLGTIPAVIVGGLFETQIEDRLREPWLVGVMLIGVGLVIWWADSVGRRDAGLDAVGPRHSLLVGLAQASALIPGVSRSGATIATARALGMERPAAARFSFLLSAPVVVGAATLQLFDATGSEETVQWGPMVLGAVVSAVAGWLVIGWFLHALGHISLRGFVWYRIVLGTLVLGLAATGVL